MVSTIYRRQGGDYDIVGVRGGYLRYGHLQSTIDCWSPATCNIVDYDDNKMVYDIVVTYDIVVSCQVEDYDIVAIVLQYGYRLRHLLDLRRHLPLWSGPSDTPDLLSRPR